MVNQDKDKLTDEENIPVFKTIITETCRKKLSVL